MVGCADLQHIISLKSNLERPLSHFQLENERQLCLFIARGKRHVAAVSEQRSTGLQNHKIGLLGSRHWRPSGYAAVEPDNSEN
ncbi:MAG: hypothetical protein A3H24_10665 [Rhodoferax sp. RIFCSPLOWO2_12_FULL_60_11]|jgi:hypothetical protein|nr:MAG: hypothetical protein A3H24_10665 [Rhodoferax sp. RIFCSPLOWO2_12_FULL_60_11]